MDGKVKDGNGMHMEGHGTGEANRVWACWLL